MEHYFDVHDFGEDAKLVAEITESKREIQKQDKNILTNNFIVQLANFAILIIKESLNQANKLKNEIGKLKGIKDLEEPLTMKEKSKLYKEAIQFFAKNSAHIEVLRENVLERCFFILHPFCHCLPKDIKTEFNDTVNRGSVKTKVTGLMLKANEFTRTMIHEEKLKLFFGRNKFLALFANFVDLWKDLSFIMTLIINFVILASFSDSFGSPDPSYNRLYNPRLFLQSENDRTELIFQYLGIIMVICSSFVVLFFICKKAPLIIQKSWEANKQNDEQSERKQGFIVKIFTFLFKSLFALFKIFKTLQVVYYIAYGIFAIIGVIFHPFFFCFHLSEILFR